MPLRDRGARLQRFSCTQLVSNRSALSSSTMVCGLLAWISEKNGLQRFQGRYLSPRASVVRCGQSFRCRHRQIRVGSIFHLSILSKSFLSFTSIRQAVLVGFVSNAQLQHQLPLSESVKFLPSVLPSIRSKRNNQGLPIG